MTTTGRVALAVLRERGGELGLDVGSSDAPPGPEGEQLRAWVERGLHAGMGWMARDTERRVDPRLVLPGARTVLSLGFGTWTGELPAPPRDRPRGRIARFALGDDYHDVLMERTRAFARLLADGEALPYVDTGPVMEKVRARRAGLGWIGRHTGAVSRRHGSWWALGAIVTRVEVEPSSQHPDHCGTCARCVAACPTGAILAGEPRVLDARRCISYLTIEERGTIPAAIRPLLGDWIFGCDACLSPCPWNRFAVPTAEPRLGPRPDLLHPALEDVILWDAATFARVTRGTAVRRAKRRGLLRNAAVALGNSGDRAAIPALARCLAAEREPLVRAHAAWALGRLGGPAARAALETAPSDPESTVRHEILGALEAC